MRWGALLLIVVVFSGGCPEGGILPGQESRGPGPGKGEVEEKDEDVSLFSAKPAIEVIDVAGKHQSFLISWDAPEGTSGINGSWLATGEDFVDSGSFDDAEGSESFAFTPEGGSIGYLMVDITFIDPAKPEHLWEFSIVECFFEL